jgi:hypothetical protein
MVVHAEQLWVFAGRCVLPYKHRKQIMAKKPEITKTQAVRAYLKTHRGATSSEIAAGLAKQGIKITPGHVANIKTKLKNNRLARKAAARPAAVPVSPAPAAAEKPTKPGDAITLEQVKKVAQTVKTIGGFDRLHEMLDVIKEVGGIKKFRDLLEAMAATETDVIPF